MSSAINDSFAFPFIIHFNIFCDLTELVRISAQAGWK